MTPRNAARTALVALLLASASLGEEVEPGYAGQQACLSCHAGDQEDYLGTVHARALTPANALGERDALGCESCHGPGAAHAANPTGTGGTEGIFDAGGEAWISFREPGAEAARRQDEACLQCHRGDRQRYWPGSPHESRGLSCTGCHAVKHPASDRHMLSRPTEDALCRQCHPVSRSEMMRASHMPTRNGTAGGGEDFMSCFSCHNSHGTIADKLVDAHTVNDNCYSCHADKRGPFLWEHAPVAESCLNCHVPHGSLKPNMLKLSAPRLCQTCHIGALHPSEARLAGSRFVRGSSCLQCHSKVHGSNHPSGSFLTR